MLQSQRKLINIFKSFIEKVFLPSIKKSQSIVLTQWKKFSTMLTPNFINNNNSNQILNYTQLQNYVDSLNSVLFGGLSTTTLANLQSPQKRDFNQISQQESSQNKLNYFKKRSTENNIEIHNLNNNNNNNQTTNNQSIGFNPSKTFGGSRTKLMFSLKGQSGSNNGSNYNQQPQMRNTSGNLNNFNISNSLSTNYVSLSSNTNSTNDWRKVNPMLFLSGMQKLSKIFADTQNKLQGLSENVVNGKFPQQQGYY